MPLLRLVGSLASKRCDGAPSVRIGDLIMSPTIRCTVLAMNHRADLPVFEAVVRPIVTPEDAPLYVYVANTDEREELARALADETEIVPIPLDLLIPVFLVSAVAGQVTSQQLADEYLEES